MGSGLIYAVIIVMWAAYFIPRWLRRHEELSESRSVERFDNAMRILSRKEPTPDQRYVVMPPRPERSRSSAPARRAGRRPAPHSSVTLRRRRVLAGLLLTTLVTGLLTPFTPVPWWGPLAALGVTVGYLVHLRLQARSSRAVSRTRAAVRKRSRSRIMRFEAVERLKAVRRELAEERAAEERRWQEAEEAERREREAEERRRQEAEAGWSPVPVPLPTYVTKPAAPRRAPTIDLTNPGAWSETQARIGQSLPEPRTAEPARHTGALSALLEDADEAEDQLDAIIQRRAVND